jgi:hypothetical protein
VGDNMRWKNLKKFWSRIATPRCFGTGGNLSSFDCGLCGKRKTCCNTHYGTIAADEQGRTDIRKFGEPCVFFFWSKEGEGFPSGRMNGDNMCRLCLNVPRIISNPKYCSGCLKNGIHTKFKQYEANPYVRNLE